MKFRWINWSLTTELQPALPFTLKPAAQQFTFNLNSTLPLKTTAMHSARQTPSLQNYLSNHRHSFRWKGRKANDPLTNFLRSVPSPFRSPKSTHFDRMVDRIVISRRQTTRYDKKPGVFRRHSFVFRIRTPSSECTVSEWKLQEETLCIINEFNVD